MFIDPRELNDKIVDQLQTFSAYLQDEVNELVHAPQELSIRARCCKEALLTINVLVPKLRALDLRGDAASRRRPDCVDCD